MNMDEIDRSNDDGLIDSPTSNGEKSPTNDNVCLSAVSDAASPNKTNYVRRMAKHFEQITDTSWNDKCPNGNIKEINWWLKAPSIYEFDELNVGEVLDGDGSAHSEADG